MMVETCPARPQLQYNIHTEECKIYFLNISFILKLFGQLWLRMRSFRVVDETQPSVNEASSVDEI
jgi:hypothetical protein